MRIAFFTNFSDEPFTGYWNGKPRTFKPGETKPLPDYLAQHYAKHLTNRELLKKGKETATSPKKPKDVPDFMELFNKAFKLDEEEIESPNEDPADVHVALAQRYKFPGQPKGYEDIGGEKGDAGADDDDESNFGGKPVDASAQDPSMNV